MKKEHIEFLKQLQHELKTHDNRSTDQPLFWDELKHG